MFVRNLSLLVITVCCITTALQARPHDVAPRAKAKIRAKIKANHAKSTATHTVTHVPHTEHTTQNITDYNRTNRCSGVKGL